MTETSEILTATALGLYAAAALVYLYMWRRSSRFIRLLAPSFLGAGFCVNVLQLTSRWISLSQPPFKTLYESLVLLSACIAVVYFLIEILYRARILGFPSALGAVATLIYAYFGQDKEAQSLPPALQSMWFIPHVVVYFFGYAAVFVAFGAALIYLFRPKPLGLNRPDLLPLKFVDLERLLDEAVRFGFLMLTFGLLAGSIWAKQAWGDYWVWDPKETWSLVSWLVFAGYIHLHYLGNWKGRKLAVLVVIGFSAVVFTYLGMNLLPTAEQSAHVYQ